MTHLTIPPLNGGYETQRKLTGIHVINSSNPKPSYDLRDRQCEWPERKKHSHVSEVEILHKSSATSSHERFQDLPRGRTE